MRAYNFGRAWTNVEEAVLLVGVGNGDTFEQVSDKMDGMRTPWGCAQRYYRLRDAAAKNGTIIPIYQHARGGGRGKGVAMEKLACAGAWESEFTMLAWYKENNDRAAAAMIEAGMGPTSYGGERWSKL